MGGMLYHNPSGPQFPYFHNGAIVRFAAIDSGPSMTGFGRQLPVAALLPPSTQSGHPRTTASEMPGFTGIAIKRRLP
jgi:hypothetical protein